MPAVWDGIACDRAGAACCRVGGAPPLSCAPRPGWLRAPPLHPFLTGQAHHIRYLHDALSYIAEHEELLPEHGKAADDGVTARRRLPGRSVR